jgi:hypothetical protein
MKKQRLEIDTIWSYSPSTMRKPKIAFSCALIAFAAEKREQRKTTEDPDEFH